MTADDHNCERTKDLAAGQVGAVLRGPSDADLYELEQKLLTGELSEGSEAWSRGIGCSLPRGGL